MKKLPLHWKIIIGMLLGVVFGVVAIFLGLKSFTSDFIAPFGTIFINLLKLMAVPLVLVSLINGVANLKDVSRLSRIGTKTIAWYMLTTVIAISVGLVLVNIIQPGNSFSEEKKVAFRSQYGETVDKKTAVAKDAAPAKPLQFLVDIVPQNVFNSMTDNTKMLQVIFFALLFGVALVLIDPEKAKPLKDFFGTLDMVVLKIIDIIMSAAPYGVFALLSGLIVDFAGDNPRDAIELLKALAVYSFTVVLGLGIVMFLIYPFLIKIIAGISPKKFFNAMGPAQLLAFSTSSSAATLPVTMECAEENLGVSKEISSFVLPLGATINMDGTALYQAVAALFIAQTMGMELNLSAQLTIILTSVLASIGSAAVPGAGMVMLVIVLESVGIDPAGIALIFGVDRILDMCRTAVNVTSDAVCATLIAKSENQLTIINEQ
jgi:Na+/H+-dicarboxylate symporter